MTSLDKMSEEQQEVYNVIARGDNAIVDACAGSGKSTTILSIAAGQPHKQFIQLTYNAMLCSEIKTKAENLKIDNLRIYTYHSLAVKYYSSDAHTDMALRQLLRKKTPPRVAIPRFDVLVIDEAQDKTFLYLKLLIRFCRDMGSSLQILVLGDYMQGLYDFKGADTRFLTRADDIWSSFESLRSPVFVRCHLKMSYRITQSMADFVNHIMLGEERLLACREGEPVVYLRRKHHDAEKYVVHKILHLMKEKGAVPSDFFILSGSVKGENSAIRKMENILVEHHIPCHVPMFENEKIDERVIDGKVVFSTFHSVKGRQRKYVFVLEFNESYFTYYARNLPMDKCPNTLYVATTRATERLFIVESDTYLEDRPLPFLKMSHATMKQQPYLEFHGMPQSIYYKKDSDSSSSLDKIPTHYVTPTDLVKFISESVLEEISPVLDDIFIPYEEEKKVLENPLDIPNVISLKNGYFEEISDLNGIAIPMMYYERVIERIRDNPANIHEIPHMNETIARGGHILKQIIENNMSTVQSKKHAFLRTAIEQVSDTCNTVAEYLYLSNVYVASKEKLYFKLKQIDISEYDWLSPDMINTCFQRLHRVLKPEFFWKGRLHAESEKTIIRSEDEGLHTNIDAFLIKYFPQELFRFTARVDLITLFSVWELKCVTTITSEHLIQVVVYAWLWRMVVENAEKVENLLDFKILNVKTGEILRLEATTEQLNGIMVKLLQGKYGEKEIKKDGDFVEECRRSFL